MSLQFIIDGYNLLNHPQFRRASKEALPAASVLAFIRAGNLTGSAKNKVIIVFDGYPPGYTSQDDLGGAVVIFSRKISADEKIKKLVEETSNRKNIYVVTNDKEIKFMIKSLGAHALAIEDFIKEEKMAKSAASKRKEVSNDELNYTQKHNINEELKKLWLK